jgi:hypothetical protein
MKLKYWLVFLLVFASSVSLAAEKDYSICAVAGFHEGNQNRFLTDLAERIAAKNNLFGDDKCTAALKEGKAAGERFSNPNLERRSSDYDIIRSATLFSNMIYDSILSRVKFQQ